MDQTYKEDEIAARGAHLNNAVQNVAAGKPYSSLNGYTPPDRGCIRRRHTQQLAGYPSQPGRKGCLMTSEMEVLKLAARVLSVRPCWMIRAFRIAFRVRSKWTRLPQPDSRR